MPRRTVVDPSFPGRLRELRRARGLSLRELAAQTYLGKSYVHDFETGHRTPSREHATRLDDALGAGGQLAALVGDQEDPLAYAAAHPHRVDTAAVAQLATDLASARQMEDELGAAPMLPTATARLATVQDLARQARGPVRPALVAVGAQWAQFGGWLHIAMGRRRRAALLLDRALEWATEVGDREMVATALSFKGHAAWLAGEVGPMIGLTEAALRDPDIHVGQRAYDHYQLARAHTITGDRRATVEALAGAADLSAESVEYTGPRPPWHYYRSQAFFDLEHGLVRELAGERAQAAELLLRGLSGLPAEMREAGWTAAYRQALERACPLSAGS